MVSLRYRAQCMEQEVRAERLRSARCIGSMISVTCARDYKRQKASQRRLVRQELRRRWEQERQSQLGRTTALLQDIELKRGAAMREAAVLRRALHATAQNEQLAWQAEYRLEDARYRLALVTRRTAEEMRDAAQTARRECRRAALAMERRRTTSVVARATPTTLRSALSSLAPPHTLSSRLSCTTIASSKPRVANEDVVVSFPPRARHACTSVLQKPNAKACPAETPRTTNTPCVLPAAAQKLDVQSCGDDVRTGAIRKIVSQEEDDNELTPRPRRETPRPTLFRDEAAAQRLQRPTGQSGQVACRGSITASHHNAVADVPRPDLAAPSFAARHRGGDNGGFMHIDRGVDEVQLKMGSGTGETSRVRVAPPRYRRRQHALALAREAAEDFRRVFIDTAQIVLPLEEAGMMAVEHAEHCCLLETLLQPASEADLFTSAPLCRLPVQTLSAPAVHSCEESAVEKADLSSAAAAHVEHDAPDFCSPSSATATSRQPAYDVSTAPITTRAKCLQGTVTPLSRHRCLAIPALSPLAAAPDAVNLSEVTNISLSSSTSGDGSDRSRDSNAAPTFPSRTSSSGATHDSDVLASALSHSVTRSSHRPSFDTSEPPSEPTEYNSTTLSSTPSRIARPTMTAEQLRVALIRLRNRMRLAQI